MSDIRKTPTGKLARQLWELEHMLAKLERDKARTVEHINKLRAELRARRERGEA